MHPQHGLSSSMHPQHGLSSSMHPQHGLSSSIHPQQQQYGQQEGQDDLQQLEQLLELQLSEMQLLSQDPAAAAAAMRAPRQHAPEAPADVGVAVAAREWGAGGYAAGAAAAWQAGFDGDVDTASGSSNGSGSEDDGTDAGSSGGGSRGSVRYRPVEGGCPTSANRIERLVAMYRQQQLAQQHSQQAGTARAGEVGPAAGGAELAAEDSHDAGAGSGAEETAGVSEMLSRFLQE
jgi:hypothetical protein